MSDSVALPSILTLTMAVYLIGMWAMRVVNELGYEIAAGVFKEPPRPRRLDGSCFTRSGCLTRPS
jgi:hypothetical protein